MRGAGREVVSRCCTLLLRGTLAVRTSDARCGFQAIRKDVADAVLPRVQDTGSFFDAGVAGPPGGITPAASVPTEWPEPARRRDPTVRTHVVVRAPGGAGERTGRRRARAPVSPDLRGRPAPLGTSLVPVGNSGRFTRTFGKRLRRGPRAVQSGVDHT